MRAATTPPVSAAGSATNSTDASRQLPKAACRRRKMPTAAATETPMKASRADCLSW